MRMRTWVLYVDLCVCRRVCMCMGLLSPTAQDLGTAKQGQLGGQKVSLGVAGSSGNDWSLKK